MSEPDEEEDEENDDFREQPGLFALHPKPDKAGVIQEVTQSGFGLITTNCHEQYTGFRKDI